MNKKKFLVTFLLMAVLGALVYFQVRSWQKFDWGKFWEETHDVNLAYILAGVALIYVIYFLRALRWKILLRPVLNVNAVTLVSPTMVGFTGLALLGRPGELIRPYLIARRNKLSMSSQMAVWTVERIFDTGAFATIMAVNILVSADHLRMLPGFASGATRRVLGYHFTAFQMFQIAAVGLLGGVAIAAALALLIRRNPAAAANFARRLLGRVSTKLGNALAFWIQEFGEGLNTVHDAIAFLQLSALSLLIWIVIGLTYWMVTRAYTSQPVSELSFSTVLLLTTASVVGGVLQLPVVGGGSQLATIGTLRGILGFSPELSTSCGMMLWLVTFMAVIPAGLILAHRERISFIRVEEESLSEEAKVEASGKSKPAT
jgi:hypothetical protein